MQVPPQPSSQHSTSACPACLLVTNLPVCDVLQRQLELPKVDATVALGLHLR